MAAKEKLSLTLDHALVEDVRRRIGGRALSAFLNEALAFRLQAQGVEEYLAELEREHGAIPPALQVAADKALRIRHTRIRKPKSTKAKAG